MKKKSIRLQKRLFLGKETIALLNKQQQQSIAGGASVVGPFCNSANCESYDPQAGCESRPRPGQQCV